MDTIEYLPLYMMTYTLAYYYMFAEKRSDGLWSFVSGLIAGAVIYFFAIDGIKNRGFDPLLFSLTVLALVALYRIIQAVAMMVVARKRAKKNRRSEVALTDEEIDNI